MSRRLIRVSRSYIARRGREGYRQFMGYGYAEMNRLKWLDQLEPVIHPLDTWYKVRCRADPFFLWPTYESRGRAAREWRVKVKRMR